MDTRFQGTKDVSGKNRKNRIERYVTSENVLFNLCQTTGVSPPLFT
jgi:hypothetical protein